MAWIHYRHPREKMSYWRTYTGIEVDVVLGDARVAIEIKSAEEVMPRHLKGVNAFREEYPQSRRIIVSLDPFDRYIDGIECVHVNIFLKMLWREGI